MLGYQSIGVYLVYYWHRQPEFEIKRFLRRGPKDSVLPVDGLEHPKEPQRESLKGKAGVHSVIRGISANITVQLRFCLTYSRRRSNGIAGLQRNFARNAGLGQL